MVYMGLPTTPPATTIPAFYYPLLKTYQMCSKPQILILQKPQRLKLVERYTTRSTASEMHHWIQPLHQKILDPPSHVLITASSPDQSNELNVLQGNDGSVSPDPKIFQWTDCTIRVFQLFCVWIMHSSTPQKYIQNHCNHFNVIFI